MKWIIGVSSQEIVSIKYRWWASALLITQGVIHVHDCPTNTGTLCSSSFQSYSDTSGEYLLLLKIYNSFCSPVFYSLVSKVSDEKSCLEKPSALLKGQNNVFLSHNDEDKTARGYLSNLYYLFQILSEFCLLQRVDVSIGFVRAILVVPQSVL